MTDQEHLTDLELEASDAETVTGGKSKRVGKGQPNPADGYSEDNEMTADPEMRRAPRLSGPVAGHPAK